MKLFFFCMIFLLPFWARASLDEISIATPDKSCSIHYLSNRPRNNWTIEVDPKSCKEGFVDGIAHVQLYSATKEKMETLGGMFRQGYWLDDFPVIGPIIERVSPSEKIQSLSFLLGEDKEANITYIGQLRAIQPEGRSYGPFRGCPDFRVLVVVSDVTLFQKEAFIDKIVHQSLSYARSYCAELDLVALFGASTVTHPEVVFQMQIDPLTGDREEIPIIPKNRVSDVVPMELREEKSDVLVSVTAEEEKVHVLYQIPPANQPSVSVPPQKKKDVLGHVKIISRVLKKPVAGRVVAHIRDVLLDGTGITDMPDEVQLVYYPGLKPGWAVITGMLHNNQMQVSDVQFCQKEWCSDVP